jgi:glycosyltransferase involved in cell wall biosynthesis
VPAVRVAQLIQNIELTGGGTSTAFINVLAALRTRPELDVRAYCLRPPPGDSAWRTIDAAPERFVLSADQGTALGPGSLGRSLAGEIEAGRVDLLHIHGLWSPDLLAAARACRRRGVPYVWEPHGMLVREAYAQKRLKKELFMLMGMRRALNGAARLVFVTAEERDHSVLPAGLSPEQLSVVPLPVVMPDLVADAAYRCAARERFGVPQDVPCVVFMGRLHPVKRVELILRAAGAMAARGGEWKDLRVLLVGGGDESYTRSLLVLAGTVGLGERAIFAGWVQGEDKWRALAAGEVLTLNSLHENFGFVAVEALCVNTAPVVTSNLAIAAEMKSAGVAEVAEPNEAALASAWERAVRVQREGSMADRGRAWVREHLSIEAVGTRLSMLYEQVAAQRSVR